MTTPSDTPIGDGINAEGEQWPNREPVIEGIDEVSQDPNFVADSVDTEVTS